MNERELFKAICAGQKPDYVPIFGFEGAPGMSLGAMRKTHERLVATGMPGWVDGSWSAKGGSSETWRRYWGTSTPLGIDFFPAEKPRGFKSVRRIEGEFEIVEEETGAVTRQVIDNDVTYSMPHFEVYPVRDRASWEFFRERRTPGKLWSRDRIEDACRRYDDRDRPLVVSVHSTWGGLRSLMGPEKACTVLYDDPELAHDIIDFYAWLTEEYAFPLIERLKPEIAAGGEDCCYNHGTFYGPAHFEEFCAPAYRKIGQAASACGAAMVAIDTDGRIDEFVALVEPCGVNAIYPCEVKACNDLFALRERHPKFIFLGWLEKECVNEGSEDSIEPEIMSKVPKLLAKGRYFPNGDHGLQPMVTFPNLCRFMTLLHEVTGNPEGEFPRMRAGQVAARA